MVSVISSLYVHDIHIISLSFVNDIEETLRQMIEAVTWLKQLT